MVRVPRSLLETLFSPPVCLLRLALTPGWLEVLTATSWFTLLSCCCCWQAYSTLYRLNTFLHILPSNDSRPLTATPGLMT